MGNYFFEKSCFIKIGCGIYLGLTFFAGIILALFAMVNFRDFNSFYQNPLREYKI